MLCAEHHTWPLHACPPAQGAPRPPSNGGMGVPGAAGASTGAGVASDPRGMLTSGIPADQLLAQQMSGTVPPAPLPSALPQWPLQQQYAPGGMALTAAGTTLAHQLQPQLPLEHEVQLAAHPPAVMPLDGVAVMLGSQDGHIAQLQLQQQTQQQTLLAAHAHATALAAAAAGTAVPMAIPGPVGDDDCSLLLGQPSGLASPPSAASGSLGGVDAALTVQLARRQGRVRSQGSSTACFTGGAPGAAAGQVRASAVAAASLGSSRVSCGGGSGSHPGVTSCVSPRITPIQSPQASLQLHRAVSTAMAAAAGGRVHTAGHTATASAAPSCCSESDSSSDDDDDDYEVCVLGEEREAGQAPGCAKQQYEGGVGSARGGGSECASLHHMEQSSVIQPCWLVTINTPHVIHPCV
jgi:hypothetical protein